MNASDVPTWRRIVESSDTDFGLSVSQTYECARLQCALGIPVFSIITEDESALLVAYGRRRAGLLLPFLNIVGGPLYRDSQIDLDAFEKFLRYIKNTFRGFIVLFTSAFGSGNRKCLKILCRNGYHPWITPTENYVIDLNRPLDDIYAHMEKRSRYAIRRAKKLGLKEEEDSQSLAEFYTLYELSNPPGSVQPISVIRLYKQCFGEKAKIFLIKLDDKYLSGMMFLQFNGRLLTYSFGGHRSLPGYSCSANLLLWSVISWALERGFRYLDLGRVHEKANLRLRLDGSDMSKSSSKILFIRSFRARYATRAGVFSTLRPSIYNCVKRMTCLPVL